LRVVRGIYGSRRILEFLITLVILTPIGLILAQPQSALDLIRQKRYAQAEQLLQEQLARQPDDFKARLLLGLCYQESGDRAQAEQVFRDAVWRSPSDPTARFYLARVEYLRARFAEAESDARRALNLGEPAAQTLDLMGLIREELNDPEAALAAFSEAARADPSLSAPDLNAGILLLKLGRIPEAVTRLGQAIAKSPRSAEAHYQRARTYLELNQAALAEKDLLQAVSISNDARARRLLAQVRAGVGRTLAPAARAMAPSPIRFRDVAQSAGLRLVLENHPTPEKHLIETMPGGVAVLDYNNDGRPDIFFTNGASIPCLQKDSPKYFNRLYRNDGGMKFTDVTEQAGVAGAGYSMGVAAGDYDNDGYADLFVAGVGQNILYHNNGDGTFTDVTAHAGIRSDGWSVAAGWLDVDHDGFLDLFVVNYVKWSPSLDPVCGDPTGAFRIYCAPSAYEGLPDTLYHNRGDGTFEDVSGRSGIGAHIGKGMSVAFADYDGDGLTDIFVSNDRMPNFLFHNRGDGTFEESAMPAGVALTDDGQPISSMGVDFRDYDNDGLPDLLVTALARETFPLFRNEGKGFFRDVTYPSRMGRLSAGRSGWSVGLFDFNNDGWKDVFTANSHVTDNIEKFSVDQYEQPNSVFANLGNGQFEDVSAGAGPDFQTPRAHRGAAFADFDGDGKVDVVVTSLGEPAELWQNVSPDTNHWLTLHLEGTRSNRDGIGAVVKVETDLGVQYNQMTSAVGYASSSLDGVHFGLGQAPIIREIAIRWPSGIVQILKNVSLDQILRVREPGP
jgi:enediyne biosynthesis protein E4